MLNVKSYVHLTFQFRVFNSPFSVNYFMLINFAFVSLPSFPQAVN